MLIVTKLVIYVSFISLSSNTARRGTKGHMNKKVSYQVAHIAEIIKKQTETRFILISRIVMPSFPQMHSETLQIQFEEVKLKTSRTKKFCTFKIVTHFCILLIHIFSLKYIPLSVLI